VIVFLKSESCLGIFLGEVTMGILKLVKYDCQWVSAVIHFFRYFLQFGNFCASRSVPDPFQIWVLLTFSRILKCWPANRTISRSLRNQFPDFRDTHMY